MFRFQRLQRRAGEIHLESRYFHIAICYVHMCFCYGHMLFTTATYCPRTLSEAKPFESLRCGLELTNGS